MILTPPPPTTSTMNNNSNLVQSILSDNRSIMVAAIIFLALVILFVLLLHVYARWFLIQARRRSARSSVTLPQVIRATTRVHDHLFVFADDFSTITKGLDSSVISSIPLFVYKVDHECNNNGVLECAICLSFFEEDEMGRKLPLCGHVFHVNCIDMWLQTHATCPICRGDIIIYLDNIHDSHMLCDNENLNQDMSRSEVISTEIVVPLHQEDIMISSNQDTILEIVVDVGTRDSSSMCLLSSSSMSSSSSQLVSDSFKKVVSRSRSERKVHPSMDLH